MLHDVVVYDIEIKRCLPDRGVPNDPAYEYAEGWNDFKGMGIAVLCAIDLRDKVPRVFMDDNLDEFGRLIEGRTVAGFNVETFDNELLRAHGINPGATYDVYRELRAATGDRRYGPGKKGQTLDDVAAANLGVKKSLGGARAPVLWQQGKIGQVIDYCLRDVSLEAALVRRCPLLIDPLTGREVQLAMPWIAPVGTEPLPGGPLNLPAQADDPNLTRTP